MVSDLGLSAAKNTVLIPSSRAVWLPYWEGQQMGSELIRLAP